MARSGSGEQPQPCLGWVDGEYWLSVVDRDEDGDEDGDEIKWNVPEGEAVEDLA